MITPRRTRLVRVPDLHAFQRAIVQSSCGGEFATVRATAVIVPTQAAGVELRHTLENLLLLPAGGGGRPAVVLPEILTRDGWYRTLHRGCPGAPRRLAAVECEVMMARAAREAIDAGHRPPFRLRPALVAEMLAFHDTMLRLGRTLDAFERLVTERLEPSASIDRGAERLLRQTHFLVASFRTYSRLVAESGGLDEHLLRGRVLAADTPPMCTRVVLTVGDRSCGTGGFWPADFDLLSRLPHLANLDVIATENVLAAGLHERLQDLLPGFEEVDFGQPAAIAGRVPTLITPAGEDVPCWVSRDREEELASTARRIKSQAASPTAAPVLDRTAVVCKRPLPYVYLAQSCLGASGVPFQAFDDLPLAAEPFAAAVDLVFRCIETKFTRQAVVALLLSPHFTCSDAIGPLRVDSVNALDAALREAGGAATSRLLSTIVEHGARPEASSAERAAVRAAAVLQQVIAELQPLEERRRTSEQCALLLAFVEAHAASPGDASSLGLRAARARAAIVRALRELRSAHLAHDDPQSDFGSFVAGMRRWMEAQTFSPRTGSDGLHLIDADAARYGDFDDVYLVGVIEREWPDAAPRTIFYPLALLNQLGWPPERLRLAAARAAFRDLVRLAGRRVLVSTFVLEDDALVEPSPLVDELGRAGLAVSVEDAPPALRITPEDALSLDPVRLDVLNRPAESWAQLRLNRLSFEQAKYHGCAGGVATRAHAVKRLETYLDCPFKYFAQTVLRLPDESDDDPREGPRAQGMFLHDLLFGFFEQWQAAGGGAITAANIDTARAAFARLVDGRLAALPRADRALWRARLLGSPVRAGIGEIVFRTEAVASADVVDRLLEVRFDGPCRLQADSVSRDVLLKGVADRIDVLEGGRVRIIDYKAGRAPDVRRAIQLPVYALQASQHLGLPGRAVIADEAAYLAFGARDPYVPLASRGVAIQTAIEDGARRAIQALDGIAAGDFPPRPADTFQCGYCPYAMVCRKDYVDGE